MKVGEIQDRLQALGSPEAAAFAARYFKTGPGQYGEGDVFLGLRVPVMRKVAREYRALGRAESLALLRSRIHEERLVALLILVTCVTAPATASGAGRSSAFAACPSRP